MCWLCACTPLKDLSSYSDGESVELPVADASLPPPRDVPPEIVIGPIQPDAAAPPLAEDAGTELEAAAPSCEGPGEAPGPDGQGCYRFVAVTAIWNVAQRECEEWGGGLVTVGSEAEDDYLVARADDEDVWLGLSDFALEGRMVWVNGEPLAYQGWAPMQPDNFMMNEDCVEKRAQDSAWNDRACNAPHAYICER